MPSEPRPSYYTLRTTGGHQATVYVAPDDDPWQAATQYVRINLASDSQLAELRIATEAEIADLTAHLASSSTSQIARPKPCLSPRPGSVPNAAVAHRATAPLRPAPLRS